MTRTDLRKSYEILELPDSASLREVQNAYLRLRKLYAGSSVALAPLEEEFSENTRRKILQQVEDAYDKLRSALNGERTNAKAGGAGERGDTVPELDRLEEIVYSGPVLRKIRERVNLNENAVFQELKIRTELLRALEEERFEVLPQVVYLKGHLQSIARLLGLQPDRVVEDYLRRYRDWKDDRGKE
ncbi:MAG: helix-turn-helix domain-containing protein [Candidatus Aminicenantes bacterium]|nr:helix-turn-helix domain-containing protein [Candidatus Aminicenantes bacterium]